MAKKAASGSARRARLESAKKRLLAESRDRPWLMGLGIARVDDRLGLIISVKPSAKSAASRMVNRLRLGVPVEIRGVEKIAARTRSGTEPSGAERTSRKRVDALRRLAAKRLG